MDHPRPFSGFFDTVCFVHKEQIYNLLTNGKMNCFSISPLYLEKVECNLSARDWNQGQQDGRRR